jgi:hypothetical protein
MSKRVSKKEESLYEPIMKALKRVFICLGECHLEISADKRFSNKVKRQFSKDTLYIIRVEGFFPDLTGFVKTHHATDLVTVEIKPKEIVIRDVFQAKEQGEIFDARYVLLVSPRPIPEEIRRFIKDRSSILNYSYNRRVVVTQYHEDTDDFEVDKELYYGSLPEPFKSHAEALENEKLEITDTIFGYDASEIVAKNIGDKPIKIVEVKVSGAPFIQNVTLEPKKSIRIEVPIGHKWLSGKECKIQLISEIGKKFLFETKV